MELITHVEAMTKNISPDFSWGLHFQEVTLITVQVSAACMPLTVPRKNEPICPFLGLKCQNRKAQLESLKGKKISTGLLQELPEQNRFYKVSFSAFTKQQILHLH